MHNNKEEAIKKWKSSGVYDMDSLININKEEEE